MLFDRIINNSNKKKALSYSKKAYVFVGCISLSQENSHIV